MTDPVGNVADTVENAGKGVWNSVKGTFNGAVRIVSPVLATYGALSAYSMLDGGVGALANLGAEGASRADMLKIPLEGFTELTEDVSKVGEWLTGKSTELAASPMLS